MPHPEDAKVHLTLADYYRDEGDNEASYKQLKAAFSSPKLSIAVKKLDHFTIIAPFVEKYHYKKNHFIKFVENRQF